MFRQFVQNFTDGNIYLILSLLLFLIFFILIGFLLIRMNKKHIKYMSELPLKDEEKNI